MIKLVSLRKSSNPNAQVSGDFNVTSDGRLYLMAEFTSPTNPFAGRIRRMIAQQFDSNGTAYWKVNPEDLKIGDTYEGNIVTASVEPYSIGDNVVTTWTGVVFGHENLATVLKNAGHTATVQHTSAASEVVEELAQ